MKTSLVCCLLALLPTSLFAERERPNIVFILADDMGSGDVQALNPESNIPTPNLNSLAEEGMTFTDAHSASAVCTPTRYALLTGRYCWRSRLKRGVLNGYGEPLIEEEQFTIAEFLWNQGYDTGIVGKWHLGLGFAKVNGEIDYTQPLSDGPHTHGFRFSYVIPASLDFPPYVYIKNGEVTQPPKLTQPAGPFPAFLRKGPRSPDLVMEDVLDDLADQASAYIESRARNRATPFFLYLPLTAPHKPVLPHPRFRGSTELGPYGDFIAQVDATVGKVLEAIDQAGIKENTLVVYSSDNGSFMFRLNENEPGHTTDETVQGYRASRHTANGPYRGTKADIWEAGHRVPFFVRWPGVVAPGSTCGRTICQTDFFATCAEVVETELPPLAAPDSFSLMSCLQGNTEEFNRAPVVHHSGSGMFAIRDGNWKLVLGNGSGGREAPKGKPFERPYQLFNLNNDPVETTNIIDQHPELATQLEETLQQIRDSESSRGSLGDG